MAPHPVATATKRMWHHLMLGLGQLHVGHRGYYSIERLQALDDYCRDTSLLRVFTVCMMLPVPAVVVAIGMEFIPLQDPKEGWKANYGIWLRFTVASVVIGLGFLLQIKQLVPSLGLTALKITCILVATTCVSLGFMLTTASLWVFPTPFSVVLAVPPFMATLVISILISIGRRALQLDPNLWRQLLQQIGIILAQASLAFAYPAFGAVYNWLPPDHQAGFVLVLPVIKVLMQNVVAWSSRHLEEYIPGTTVFSVELFNALYTAKCMQKASSIFTYMVILAIDVIESFFAIRHVKQTTLELQRLKKQYNPANPKQHLLNAVVEICQQPGVLGQREGSFVRMHSPISFQLSHRNSEIFRRISSAGNATAAVPPDTDVEIHRPAASVPVTAQSTNPNSVSPGLQIAQLRVFSVVPEAKGPAVSAKEKKPANDAASQLNGHLEMTATQKHDLVEQVLKMLFECEYIVLVEYIECVIPIMYAIYVAIVSQLPNAAWIPELRIMTTHQAQKMIENILMYAWLEVLSFIALHYIIKWRFGFSPAYLLAFVLENQSMNFVGLLMLWYVYILGLTVDQFGMFAHTGSFIYRYSTNTIAVM